MTGQSGPINLTPYFRPPPRYKPPTKCVECKDVIFFGPVIGGHLWMHLTRPTTEHRVVMRKAGYWDTLTGETVRGNPLRPWPRKAR